MTVKFSDGKVSIVKGGRVVGSGRRSGQLYALDDFQRADAVSGGFRVTAITAGKLNCDKLEAKKTRGVRAGEPVEERA